MNRRIILIASTLAAVAVAAVLATTAVLGGSDGAPGDVASNQAPVADAPASASHGAGGVGEGIGVKGHWQLTVVNADGSVAATHEFDNALMPEGELALARLLSGDSVVSQHPDSGWFISLALSEDSFVGQCPPGSLRTTSGDCIPSVLNRYAAFADTSRDNASVILTIETEEFAGPGTVTAVDTGIPECTSESAGFPNPEVCVGSPNTFTSTVVDPVEISEGQRILVTVTLSFTTG